VHAYDFFSDDFIDIVNGAEDTFSDIGFGVTVPEFYGLMNACGRSGRNGGSPERTVVAKNVGLNGRISP
jgi:hypothetical protein